MTRKAKLKVKIGGGPPTLERKVQEPIEKQDQPARSEPASGAQEGKEDADYPAPLAPPHIPSPKPLTASASEWLRHNQGQLSVERDPTKAGFKDLPGLERYMNGMRKNRGQSKEKITKRSGRMETAHRNTPDSNGKKNK